MVDAQTDPKIASLRSQSDRRAEGQNPSQVDYKIYWPNIYGLKDEHDIIDWSEEFIVYFNSKIDREIDWDTSSSYETRIKGDPKKLLAQNEILADAAILEAKDCTGFSKDAKEWFRYLLGKAYVFTFQEDYVGARKTLLAAERFFNARSKETSRWWYLIGSTGAASLFMLPGLVVWFAGSSAKEHLGLTLFWLTLCASAGAAGALLSVITRSWRLDFDSSAGAALHYLETACRITMGAFSGIVVGLAVNSGLALDALTKATSAKHAILILAGFAAGASERMVGSIISKFEQAGSTSQEKASRTVAAPH